MSETKADYPLHLFHHGVNYKSYEFFGAHETTVRKKKGFVFRVWAPRAKSVSLIGDFNGWNPSAAVMERKNGLWECFLPDLTEYTAYKYAVTGPGGRTVFKAISILE